MLSLQRQYPLSVQLGYAFEKYLWVCKMFINANTCVCFEPKKMQKVVSKIYEEQPLYKPKYPLLKDWANLSTTGLWDFYGTQSQNSFICKIPNHNGNCVVRSMQVGSGVEAGQLFDVENLNYC